MADKTVVVRYIARGASQVGAQALAVAKSHTAAARQMARAGDQLAARSRAIAGVAAFAGKAVLVGLGAAFAVSAKAAIDFESSMAGVYKTLGDTATNAQIVALGDALREMSLVTPVNVNDLAGIAELGGQLGVGVQDMEKFVATIAALDVSTNLNFDDAAKGLARFSNIMQLPISDVDKLGNVIVDLGNNLATTESEILTFALRLAPIGKTVGATEEQIFGISAAFSSLGIPAERGATALQRSFLDIERAVDSGGPKLLKFAQAAGMSTEEFIKLDSIGRFVAFTEGLRDIQDEGGSALTTLKNLKINQQRTIQVLLAAAGAGDLLRNSLELANEAGDNGNAMWEEAARRYGTTESQIRLMANAFNDLRIELGAGLIPFIREMLGWMKDLFMSMKENAGAIKAFAKALLVIVGAKGLLGLGVMIFKAVDALRAMKAAWATSMLMGGGVTRQLGFVSTALGGLVGVLGVAVLAFTAYTAWQARSARKARLLREQVEGLNDAIDAGSSVETTLADFIGESLNDGSSDKLLEFFRFAGIGTRELAVAVSDLDGTGMEDLIARMVEYKSTTEDAFFETDTISEEQAGSLRMLGQAISFVGDMRVIAAERQVNAEQRVTDELLNQDAATQRLIAQARQLYKAYDPPKREISFLDAVYGGSKEAVKAWEDFVKDSGQALDDYRQNVIDAFDDTRDAIAGGIGAWDDYGGKVRLSLWKARKAMKLRLKDAIEWNETLKTLIASGATTETITFFENYSLEEKAALTALLKRSPKKFFEYVEQWEDFIDDINQTVEDNLEIRGIFRQKMDEFVIEMISGARGLEEQGISPWEGFVQSTFDELAKLPVGGRALMIESIRAMADSGVLAEMFGVGQNVIDALIRGMIAMRGPLIGAMGGLGDTIIEKTTGKLGIASPSKVFFGIGEDVTKGFMMGINKDMGDLRALDGFAGTFRRASFGGASANQTTVNNSNSQATTVVVQDANYRDLRSDISAGLIAGGVNRQVEVLVKR